MGLFCFIILLAVMLSSCVTKSSQFNESDANYVMHTVLETSINKAISKTVTYVDTSETFIPKSYSVLEDNRHTVAGLDSLLCDWTDYVKQYTAVRIPDFRLILDNLSESFVFADPVNIAKGSKTSVTELFKSRNLIALTKEINELLSDIDTTAFERAANQYNQWVNSSNKLINTKPLNTIKVTSVKPQITAELLQIFFENMAFSEELFRTTPQPDMESVVEHVLGFN